MVPFNNTGRIFSAFEEEISKAVIKSAASGFWLMGEETRNFEKSFADYCGVENCVTVANGTDALEIALKAILLNDGVNGQDSEVITVANAGGYSTTACRLIGVTPVYADIDRRTHLIDLESMARCLGDKTRAVVVTHLYGGIVDVPKIRHILNSNGFSHVKILEDCAQAHGGQIAGKRVGSFGDIAAFSFYPTKNLGAMGDAGAIVTSDLELFKTVSQLKQYGWSDKYVVALCSARNSRIDEIQAAVLNVILPHLDNLNNKRKLIHRRYVEAASRDRIEFLDYANCDYVGHLAVAKVEDRKSFLEYMREKGVSVDVHYPILDTQQPAWIDQPFKVDEYSGLRESKMTTTKIVTVPLFPFMTELEVETVVNAISEWSNLCVE